MDHVVPSAIKAHLLEGERVVAVLEEGHGMIVATDWRVLHQRQADRAAFAVTPYNRVSEYVVDHRVGGDKASMTLQLVVGPAQALRGTSKQISEIAAAVDAVLRG